MLMTLVGEPECLLNGIPGRLTEPRALGTCVQVHTHLGETQACGHTQTRKGVAPPRGA